MRAAYCGSCFCFIILSKNNNGTQMNDLGINDQIRKNVYKIKEPGNIF